MNTRPSPVPVTSAPLKVVLPSLLRMRVSGSTVRKSPMLGPSLKPPAVEGVAVELVALVELGAVGDEGHAEVADAHLALVVAGVLAVGDVGDVELPDLAGGC
jgi:hypothetical protein